MTTVISTALLQSDEHGDMIRPQILNGKTMKLRLNQGSLYITLNSNGKPLEVFVELGKSGADFKADAEAFGRLISLYLQTGGELNNVVKALKGIKGSQVSWGNGEMQIYSVPDAIAKGLDFLMGNVTPHTKALSAPPTNPEPEPLIKGVDIPNGPIPDPDIFYSLCPDCHEEAVVQDGGCNRCTNCGFSKCG